MKVNKSKEVNINAGDVIYYGDGSTYMIGETVENKYIWISLNNGTVGSIEYDSVNDLISEEFDDGFDVFNNSNVELNLK